MNGEEPLSSLHSSSMQRKGLGYLYPLSVILSQMGDVRGFGLDP